MTQLITNTFCAGHVKHCSKCAAILPAGRKHTYCSNCQRKYMRAWEARRAMKYYRWTIERGRQRLKTSEAA